MPDWIVWGTLGLIGWLAFKSKTPTAPNSTVSGTTNTQPSASPGTTTGYTSPRQAFAAGDLPGFPASPGVATTTPYGQAIYPSAPVAPGGETEIPGWLGNAIDNFFGFGGLPKVTDMTAGYNAGVYPNLAGYGTNSAMIETYPGSGVFVKNPDYIPPENQGPVDPNLIPNYDPYANYAAGQIAADQIAQQAASGQNYIPASQGGCDPIPVYDWVVQPDGSKVWSVVGEETPDGCFKDTL